MEAEDKNVIMSGELAVKEAELKSETLAASKDKAQFTATTAMSIVHITLLKEVLDKGPASRYYYVSLTLISAALVLQIIVGIVTIVAANIRKYYDQYRDEMCKEFFQHVFGFQCLSRARLKREKRIRSLIRENEFGLDLSKWNMVGNNAEHGGLDYEAEFDEEIQGCCPKSPCFFTRRTHPNYEYDILDRYDVWCEQSVRSQLSLVQPREEVARIRFWLGSAKLDVTNLEADLESETSETGKEEIKAKLKALQDKIAREKTKAEDMEKIFIQEKTMSAQGKILFQYTDAIRKNRTLKLVSFWQHVINYMLFFVFIINAFIAGFGLVAPAAESSVPQVGGENTSNVVSDM